MTDPALNAIRLIAQLGRDLSDRISESEMTLDAQYASQAVLAAMVRAADMHLALLEIHRQRVLQ